MESDDVAANNNAAVPSPIISQQQQQQVASVTIVPPPRSNNRNGNNNNTLSSSSSTPSTATTAEQILATIALCMVVLTHGYIMVSIFPYAGYMTMDLLKTTDDDDNTSNENTINEQTVGYAAGWLNASFFLGHAAARPWWPRLAESYGRVAVLLVSLNLSLVASLLLGLSPHFGWALLWRLLLGASCHGTLTAKTITAELACGDASLEQRGVTALQLAWGLSILTSPTLAGATAQPLEQYPDYWEMTTEDDYVNDSNNQHSATYYFFQTYPYFMPNLVAALLCVTSVALVNAFVPEPLPKVRFRDARHLPRDIFTRLKSMLSTIQEQDDEDSFSLLSNSQRNPSLYGSITADDNYFVATSPLMVSRNNNGQGRVLQRPRPSDSLRQFTEHDIQDVIRTVVMTYNNPEISPLTQQINNTHHASPLVLAMARQTNLAVEEQRRQRISDINNAADMERQAVQPPPPPEQDDSNRMPAATTTTISFASLWSTPNVRNHLIVYWMGSFALVAIDDAIPLFLLAHVGGLALSAKAIGVVLSGVSALYFVSQYVCYSKIVQWLGIYGSIKACLVLTGPVTALLPVVLRFKDEGAAFGPTKAQVITTDDYGPFSWAPLADTPTKDSVSFQDLTWTSLIYLSVMLAIFRLLCLTALSSLTIASNRICITEHRDMLNRFNLYGSSIVKIFGPVFGGVVVAFCLSSGIFANETIAATFVFFIFAMSLVFIASMALVVLRENLGE